MIPSKSWFPSSLQERAAWFANFAVQFAIYAIGLGFKASDVTAVNEWNDDFQTIADDMVQLENFRAALIEYRISVTEGEIGDPKPVFPSPTFTTPPNNPDAGMFEQIDKLRTRILASPTYTPEIGEALDILPGEKTKVGDEELKPAIKATPSFEDYKFTVDVTRLGMPGYRVEMQRNGSTAWVLAAFATSNPCEVTVTPTTPGQPERILVRAVLLKNNEDVGQPSDPTYVTLNP